jgi:hypothetical protein
METHDSESKMHKDAGEVFQAESDHSLKASSK